MLVADWPVGAVRMFQSYFTKDYVWNSDSDLADYNDRLKFQSYFTKDYVWNQDNWEQLSTLKCCFNPTSLRITSGITLSRTPP